MTTPQLYASKPTTVYASDPVTTDNRAEVLAWMQRWGGKGKLTPDGYEVALMVDTISGWADVRYGDRVLYNQVDFYPCAPKPFETRWEPLPAASDPEAGGAPLLDQPAG